MATSIEHHLREMGLALPNVASPQANYAPWVISGNHIYISGQLPIKDGKLEYTGKLGAEITLEQGNAAAKLCALQLLAQLNEALAGEIDRVRRCIKLTGFVNSTPDFTDHPKVINGASDLLVQVLGDKGKHARSAIGVTALPLGAAVEIEAIFEFIPS